MRVLVALVPVAVLPPHKLRNAVLLHDAHDPVERRRDNALNLVRFLAG